MKIEMFAKMIGVPVFRAGSHNGYEFSESDLDVMVASSNACSDFVRASAESGAYEENPHITLQAPIPALVNLNHQQVLPDTMKAACREISAYFYKKLIDGKNWIVADLSNVKSEVATFLASKFPQRSVELIPSLYNPFSKTTYKNVIRSIGFLDMDTTPAVSGQTPNLAIEFEQEQIITLYSDVEFTELQESLEPVEVCNMEDKKTVITNIEEDTQAPIVSSPPVKAPDPTPKHQDREGLKLQEFEAKLQEFEERTKTAEAQAKVAEKKAEVAQVHWQEERTKREAGEIQQYCKDLAHEQHAAPAALKLVEPILDKLDNSGVIEFSEGNKQTVRQAIQGLVTSLITMKKEDALTVPIGEFSADAVQIDDTNKASRQELQTEKIAEFAQAAKAEATDPKNQGEVWSLAYQMAIGAEPTLFD